ncbi:family 78 glycoside hydrolase catalytic domain [Actinomadura miaoliensis]|uniref:alpha-L-rhamnosidase n=1 Tax=Actinomadura miaoliensis TaxID=430685 RepID=A0ABP7W7N3_9ACTN
MENTTPSRPTRRHVLQAGAVGAGAAVALGPSLTDPASAAAPGDRPERLTVEYAEQPLGLDVPRPRLAWLPPAGTTRQTAYQIRVTRHDDDRPVWDSGRVASDATAHVEYAGPTLVSRTRYRWQVRTWDERGRPSPWSRPSWWEMGLLRPEDWRARWIGGRQDPDHDWADQRTTFVFTLTGDALDFLFRARPVGKTYGETYTWRVTAVDGVPTLVAQVRRYPGGSSSDTTLTTLKRVPITNIAPGELRNTRHTLAVEARGTTITTWIDGERVDTLTDGAQKSGTIGVRAETAAAGMLHEVTVETGGERVFHTDFARGANPFTGGDVTGDGLAVPGQATGKDIVLPIATPAPLLRREFTAKGRVKRARLYVAAGGFPKLSLNGRQVGDAAIENGFTAYDKRVLYRTYDVTDAVRQGGNVLGAELGRGWYGLADPNEWYWHQAPWHAQPALKAQLEITFTDGRHQLVTTDGSWRATDGPTRYDSIYGDEHHDARRALPGWDRPGFDDRTWRRAATVAGPSGRLVAAQLEPIRPVAEVAPVSVTEAKPGVWVFDFGRIFAGWVRLDVSGPAGQTVTLFHCEKLNADGTGSDAGNRLIDTQLQNDRYTLAGRGRETWEPSFGYKGFRYVQVTGFPGRPTRATLTGRVVHSSVPSTGTFTSSDELLNKIQQAARNTLLNNTHGFVTDTPTYEKNGWTGDAHASALAAACNFGMARVWTKWLADFRDAQSPKGEIPEIVPSTPLYGYENTPGWNMIWGAVPSWDAATFVLPWEMYTAYGDTRILAEMYDTHKKLVDYTRTYFTDDHVYANKQNVFLGEYAGKGPVGPVDATASAYYFYMADRLSESARLLGDNGAATRYRTLAGQIRDAYNKRYWDASRRVYRTVGADGTVQAYAQTQNALPLAFGMVPDGQEKAVARSLNDDIVAQGHHLTAGVFAGRFLMTLLSDHGYTDTAYKVATRTTEPSWGHWIVNGHSTMFEGWALTSRSYDHHYWGSVSSWFYQGLAGIRPGRPGYRTVTIRPGVPTGLDRAAASLDTVRGRVESAWSRDGDRFDLRVRVPAGTAAEVWVPGRNVRAPAGARFLRHEDGHAVHEAGAGTFAFGSTYPA